MFNTVVPTALQDMAKAHQVALDVSRGILKGVANAGLSREVDNNSRLLFSEESH